LSSDVLKNSRTRIKICGITRPQDLVQAALLGVDAVGFVFYPLSKRFVTATQAAKLSGKAPAFINTVALFVNPNDEDVQAVIDIVSPSVLQFHGDECSDQCASFGVPYVKAFRVGAPGLGTPDELVAACLQHPYAAGWLFDSYTPAFGGSGASFDYSLLSGLLKLGAEARPFILSGGLSAANVESSLSQFSAWAVDVSSGVEDSAGIKSLAKMRSFTAAVAAFDRMHVA